MSLSYSKRAQLVECPRDAMQGWKTFIPTQTKITYLNNLLKVGFDTLDCGSFVSAKAIPQMADTKDVIGQLSLEGTKTKLLVIVANVRGAEEATQFDQISYLGFPLSISPTFQKRNTNSSIEESLVTLDKIQNLCLKSRKELVLYLSMGFGNPYGDEYTEETVLHWADEMVKKNIKIISLADTIGIATPDQINFALATLIAAYPQAEFGVHLHSTAINWREKLEAAVEAGCKRFDGALKGIGGCPMATNDLIGNMNTEWMIRYFKEMNIMSTIDEEALANSLKLAEQIFI
ncbi:hydroxymethylglutaryl-CoA lyase [Segetibacter aerophilus]|uniref:Hydroxymethylglutaryl-CoA lyase n=1 Tax=Segetibacter aerophilus TaxID=670293 RepID=A0A512BGD4_9BACT|nr:hydroxymethylglutaryl-CoA lyase [Segetibacter aerophilus]GEO11028.1 hydroxymethylglutaryl-CoA lyase [Segetibacter aerophilus]